MQTFYGSYFHLSKPNQNDVDGGVILLSSPKGNETLAEIYGQNCFVLLLSHCFSRPWMRVVAKFIQESSEKVHRFLAAFRRKSLYQTVWQQKGPQVRKCTGTLALCCNKSMGKGDRTAEAQSSYSTNPQNSSFSSPSQQDVRFLVGRRRILGMAKFNNRNS